MCKKQTRIPAPDGVVMMWNNVANKIAALLAVSLFLYLYPSISHAVHKGAGDLTCGNCHTMHNSQGSTTPGDGNAPLGGNAGGSLILLRGAVTQRKDIHKLCLQCHASNGAQANTTFQPHGQKAPKVWGGASINWDETKDFGKIGAGGDFFRELDSNYDLTTGAGDTNALGYGHSMGLVNPEPPGFAWGSPFSNEFSCTVCHDPHGAARGSYAGYNNFQDNHGMGVNTYRNLKLFAVFFPPYYGIMEETKSWVGGITGKFSDSGSNYVPVEVNGVAVWPVFKSDSTVAAENNVYDGVGVEGMSGFCSQCHTYWHEDRVADYTGQENFVGEDWKRHPVNKVINGADVSGVGVSTIDWANYNSMPAGFKLPAANTGADLTQEFYFADTDNEDKVMCLSCHFAHGGPYYDNLRWDYLASVGQGTQSGNSIASNKGCQMCHKR